MFDKEFFIYPKDKKGKRTGHIICVILKNNRIFQGTALCSETDTFNYKLGKSLAKDRAIEAYYNYNLKKLKQE